MSGGVGVAVMMEAVRILKTLNLPLRRSVRVGFWSGEELGLIGSNAFSTKPPVPLDTIAAYLNFDMVGRMQDNKLTVQATGSSPAWGKIIEQANVAAGERGARRAPGPLPSP